MIKVLFVCHGNICRSPMAEFVMKHLVEEKGLSDSFYIASSATSTEELGHDIHHGTRKKLQQEGIPFERRRAVQLRASDYDEYDLIIAMDSNNMRNIKRIIPDDKYRKICKLLDFTGKGGDIADPWYTGNFDETFDDIRDGCNALLRFVLENLTVK